MTAFAHGGWLRHGCPSIVALTLAMCGVSRPSVAQDRPALFAGAVAGFSTLSADAGSVTSGPAAAVSLYEPRNGPAVNAFVGIHLSDYFSLQANWIWNRNDLRLLSSFTTPQGGGFYEQRRNSRQHAVVFDGLIYFRGLDSAVRPYLGTGLSIFHFSSRDHVAAVAYGLAPPSGAIASTRIGVRSHVGIDFELSPRLSFRYSFSETISRNPISPTLSPPGQHVMMNFQNLFGIVRRF